MFEWRFRQELEKLEKFVPAGVQNNAVWRADFPAWRALFSSLCLYGHSTGYRLPSFEDFYDYVRKAYTVAHPENARFKKYFEDVSLIPGTLQRLSVWYESGMAETHLYCSLVDVIEDDKKLGLVLYDTRADWKLKADMIVLIGQKATRISAFFGDETNRPNMEARRDDVEKERKRNTLESAHWENRELAIMPKIEIARTATQVQMVNGIRLFSKRAIDNLIAELLNPPSSNFS